MVIHVLYMVIATLAIIINTFLHFLHCLLFFRHIWKHEGPTGLFRGLGPNLIGVAPSRAIYFWSYSTTKKELNSRLPLANRDSPFVHVMSAASAGNDLKGSLQNYAFDWILLRVLGSFLNFLFSQKIYDI